MIISDLQPIMPDRDGIYSFTRITTLIHLVKKKHLWRLWSGRLHKLAGRSIGMMEQWTEESWICPYNYDEIFANQLKVLNMSDFVPIDIDDVERQNEADKLTGSNVQ